MHVNRSSKPPSGHVAPARLRLPVLYTKQIQKKRKTFSDGILKVSFSKGSCYCTLIEAGDVREMSLENRSLEPAEVQMILNKVPHTLKLEKHLVEVSFDEIQPTVAVQQPLSKIPKKFVAPSRYDPPERFPESDFMPRSTFSNFPSSSATSRPVAGVPKKKYGIEDDELDVIWNSSSQTNHDSDQPEEPVPFSHSSHYNEARRAHSQPPTVSSTSTSYTFLEKDRVIVSPDENEEEEDHLRPVRNEIPNNKAIPKPEQKAMGKNQHPPKAVPPPAFQNNDSLFEGFHLSSSIWND
jgi:hypothetical protein